MNTPPKPMLLRACALLALLTVVGCQQTDSTLPAVPPHSQNGAGDDGGLVLQMGGTVLGDACHTDQDCQQPLRCLNLQCVRPPGVDGEASEDAPRIVLDIGGEHERTVFLEVADTSFEVQRGLMYRTKMAEDWGMLFVFDQDEPRSFWMRNTFIPLDMLFIQSSGEVAYVAKNARPLDEGPRYETSKPVRYVLELNGGFADKAGVTIGQRVRLVDVPGVHDPAIMP